MKIERMFDLAYAVYSQESYCAGKSERAGADAACTFILIKEPHDPSAILTRHAGFFLRPKWIEHRLVLSTDRYPNLQSYIQSLPYQRRRQCRRVSGQVQQLIASGEIEFQIDQTGDPAQLLDFIQLHSHVMKSRPLGRENLKARLEEAGIDNLVKQFPLAMYVRDRQGLKAGLLAYKHSDGYSIGFCVSHPQFPIQNVQLYLLLQLLEISLKAGSTKLQYGTDTNLYGHHLSMGLLHYKSSLKFQPRAQGEYDLLKYIGRTAHLLPLSFFTFCEKRPVLNVLESAGRSVETELLASSEYLIRKCQVNV